MSEVTHDGAATAGRPLPRPAHLSKQALVIPAILVALGVFLVAGTVTMGVVGSGGLFGPTVMPWAVAVLAFVVAGLLTVDILRPRPEYDTPSGAPTDASDGEAGPDPVNVRAVGTAIGGVVGFIVVLPWLGWILSATVLFTVVAVALGSRAYLTCLLAGLALASVIQIVFSGLLGISLPAGFVGGL
jgi:putative tricarboxylic transport membrane protein